VRLASDAKADSAALVQVDSGAIPEDEEVEEKLSECVARKEMLGRTAVKKPAVTISFKIRRVHTQVNYVVTAESRARRT
jgi:hypothetical protein